MGKLSEIFSALATVLLALLIIFLSSCHHKESASTLTSTTIVAKSESQIVRLYFKGTLLPLRTLMVLSPIDGVVNQIKFNYGEIVQKDQTLVFLQATKLVDTFRTTLSDYLQKKENMEQQEQKYLGDKELYAAGVMSKQDFLASGGSYATSVLNFNQSRYELDRVLMQLGVTPKDIEALRLADTQQVSEVLKKSFAHVPVKAPSRGVVLIPIQTKHDQSGGSSGSDGGATTSLISQQLQIGAQVQAQQAIVSLGDLTGYQISVEVSELDIVRLKPGLKAVITGDAFPGVVLNGVVKQVAFQADPNQSGGGQGAGISMFNVLVEAPTVSAKDQCALRVGMTAKVEIQIKNPPQIMIPLSAVVNTKGKLTATILDPKTGQPRVVEIKTGITSQNEVAILEGIKEGDKVVVPKEPPEPPEEGSDEEAPDAGAP
ncbi:MAG: hypothetical protein A3F10_00865 [Coxiella sp. RIFCSPHIGHO2_12_FULL_42_15]|nr:MAG: hypothetical protein A3F10_00865 [Coxiella sp. RIFCSPHIGHO2_12_FULL_42_15]